MTNKWYFLTRSIEYGMNSVDTNSVQRDIRAKMRNITLNYILRLRLALCGPACTL